MTKAHSHLWYSFTAWAPFSTLYGRCSWDKNRSVFGLFCFIVPALLWLCGWPWVAQYLWTKHPAHSKPRPPWKSPKPVPRIDGSFMVLRSFSFSVDFPSFFFFYFFFCDPLPHFLHSVCLRIFAIMETNVVLLNLSIGWQKLPKENIALDGEFVFMGAPACLFIRWAELRCVYAPCSPFSLSLKVDWRRTWVFNLYDVFHGLIEEKQSARQWTMWTQIILCRNKPTICAECSSVSPTFFFCFCFRRKA